MTEAMFWPQWQMNTPTRGGSSVTSRSQGYSRRLISVPRDLGQLVHGAGGGRRGLGHRLGDVLGLLEGSGHVEAGLGGGQRSQPVGLGEAELVEVQPQPSGRLAARSAGTCIPTLSTTRSNSCCCSPPVSSK